MRHILYSGNQLNDTHLKRINCILQSMSCDIWASVETYDYTYRKAYRKYLEGWSYGNDGSSDGSEANSYISNMNSIISANASNIQGIAEAQQEAIKTRSENDFEEQKEENNTPAPIVDGLPSGSSDRPTDPYDLTGANLEGSYWDDDIKADLSSYDLDEYEAQKAAADAAIKADIAGEDAEEAKTNYEQAKAANEMVGDGSATYTNQTTGEEQTYTRNGQTETLTGVTWTDSEGNTHVGTVAKGADGTMTVTDPNTGETQSWHGGTPHEIVNEATQAAQAQADQAQTEYEQSLEDYNQKQAKSDEISKENVDVYNQYAHDVAEAMRQDEPSGNEGGYSESDSSTWSDPSYDPSEWDF